jgi:hypothetical protein
LHETWAAWMMVWSIGIEVGFVYGAFEPDQ